MAIRRLGVVGAGTMGAGIAEVAIGHGFSVVLCDVEERIVAGAEAGFRVVWSGGRGAKAAPWIPLPCSSA